MPVDSNPFAILTFIAAPAVLTNAASVLAMGTSTRFARNVDRSRQLIKLLESIPSSPEVPAEVQMQRRLLEWLDRRMAMLMRAMSMLYFAIGCFAAGSLTSLLGAIISTTQAVAILDITLGIALLVGIGGLGGLIAGGLLLVRESRLALLSIREEMRFYRVKVGA